MVGSNLVGWGGAALAGAHPTPSHTTPVRGPHPGSGAPPWCGGPTPAGPHPRGRPHPAGGPTPAGILLKGPEASANPSSSETYRLLHHS